jgi:hypothetical protein
VDPRDDDPDDDAHELVHAAPLRPMEGPEAVAHLLAQSNRESAANRAQARELIKALQGVQQSQEYLGVALREERRRSRWLLALVVLFPLAAGAAVWWMAARVDDVRSDVSDRIAKVAAEEQAARAAAAQGLRDAHIEQLTQDLSGLRGDLDASRVALLEQQKHLAERETALTAAEGRTDSARTEIGALEFEVTAARSKANAEQARSAQLENRIKELQAELDARRKAPSPPAPAETARLSAAPGDDKAAAPAPSPAAAVAKPAPAREAPASDAAETENIRRALNALLRDADDAVRYQIHALGGAAGRTLSALRVVGTDDRGVVVRTIQAARAEITIDASTGSIVMRFREGKLIVGTVEAPFFDGNYGLVVRGDAAKWKSAGLSCVGTQ